MSCPRRLFVGFPSRSTGSPLTKSIGTRSITRDCLSSTVRVFKSFLQRLRSPAASRHPRTVFPCAFRFTRVIALPQCRNASPDRRSVSGRTQRLHRSQYLVATRLIRGRNALAEYPARLIFFFAWNFSSADVIPEAQPY